MHDVSRNWSLTMGLAIVGVCCIVAAAAPLLSPYSPDAQNMTNVLRAPSAAHPFGTDEYGRDTLSRIFYGARLTLLASSFAVTLASEGRPPVDSTTRTA